MARPLIDNTFSIIDANGKPIPGGQVYTYHKGTTNPKPTYTDSTAATRNANPVILNANGKAAIYGFGYFTINVLDASGAQVDGWPQNISPIGDDDNVYTVSSDPNISDQSTTFGSDYEAGNLVAIIDFIGTNTAVLEVKHGSYDLGGNTVVIPENILFSPNNGAVFINGTLSILGPYKERIFSTASSLMLSPGMWDGEVAYLSAFESPGDDGHGKVQWLSGDYSSYIAIDIYNGVYFPVDGSNGVWKRLDVDTLIVDHFGGKTGLAINAAAALDDYSSINILRGEYITDVQIIIENALCFAGSGYIVAREGEGSPGVLRGSIIKADDTSIENLVAIKSDQTAPESDYAQTNVTVRDIGLFHRGSGAALTIDNVFQSEVMDVGIFCNSEGAIGVSLINWSFLTKLSNLWVQNFTNTGIYIASGGSQVIVDNPVINAGVLASYGIQTLNAGTIIRDGQVNVAGGVGIYFHNISDDRSEGGLVEGTLCETGTGIRIEGDSNYFSNVILKNTVHTLGSGQIAVEFGPKSLYCKIVDPIVRNPTGGTIASWEAGSINCGVIGGYDVCRAGVSVDEMASGAYMICNEPLGYANRANISTDPNLKVIINDCQYLGTTIHNGVSWDKYYFDMADNTAQAVTPPTDYGIVEIIVESIGGYALVSFSLNILMADIISNIITVDLTSGTLSGNDGVDGEFTIRKDNTSDDLYLENRLGSTRSVILKFIDKTRG